MGKKLTFSARATAPVDIAAVSVTPSDICCVVRWSPAAQSPFGVTVAFNRRPDAPHLSDGSAILSHADSNKFPAQHLFCERGEKKREKDLLVPFLAFTIKRRLRCVNVNQKELKATRSVFWNETLWNESPQGLRLCNKWDRLKGFNRKSSQAHAWGGGEDIAADFELHPIPDLDTAVRGAVRAWWNAKSTHSPLSHEGTLKSQHAPQEELLEILLPIHQWGGSRRKGKYLS